MTSFRPNTEKPTDAVDYIEDPTDNGFKKGDAAVDAALRGQTVSGYESLTIWETAKLFKVATISCFVAAFSAATDGYQIGQVPSPSNHHTPISSTR
ncbi:hypothetical protein CGMCC3_g4093 [Colletotrichum fructicola]|uniref:Uncharacterized protein n=1 Tax=Colletotrichum fructicola (strain Nara gc5) TaxID=1213859 RepID=A0A7J6JCB3_COLFN|nr:uncharacterized protein CGMCC3_g4093 [Colletotrichum fructicola]KAE9579552.1 hypothetical protein CGMCC3_g4093 [Colletotrichum fructicola]KAF4486806.1 hypothetical protein CGGC5_v006351 [Colletotrichum fructicola Nara gc5]KAF5486576.1 hypothetical protein CGCF413_v013922 [Colletotrichum fructicola]